MTEPTTSQLVTGTDVAAWCEAPAVSASVLETIAAAATESVAAILGGVVVPPSTHKLAILTVAAAMLERRNAPNGVRGFGPDGTPVRVSADDTRNARLLLASWLPPGVA